ncbi:MAG: DUF3617 domain-containing protein [Acidobacteriaceae bacterium]
MRVFTNLFAVSSIAGLCACAALAQKPNVPFQPGEWNVNLTMVLNNGKPMNTEMRVCAANPEDAWNQKRPGQICDPVQFTRVPGGVHVQIHCKGGSGQVVTEMHVDMMTHFSSDGASYTENGTSTSSTTMLGHPPMVMNIQMKGQGKRIGPCASAAKP